MEKDYDEIHFWGDKCYEGGNDFEIYKDKRTIGHSVKDPDQTVDQLRVVFGLQKDTLDDLISEMQQSSFEANTLTVKKALSLGLLKRFSSQR